MPEIRITSGGKDEFTRGRINVRKIVEEHNRQYAAYQAEHQAEHQKVTSTPEEHEKGDPALSDELTNNETKHLENR